MKLTSSLPYVIVKPRADGTFGFYFQPSSKLRAKGIEAELLGVGRDPKNPPEDVKARAEELLEAVKKVREQKGRKSKIAVHIRRGVPTFSDLVDRFKATKHWRDLAVGSKESYTAYLAPLLEWCGETPIDRITRAEVREHLLEVEKRTPAMATQMQVIGRLVFKNYIDDRPNIDNPFLGKYLDERARRRQVWPQALVRHVVDACDLLDLEWLGTTIMLLNFVGQRPGDTMLLSTRTWHEGRLWVHQQKTNAVVLVPPFSALLRRLRQYPPRNSSQYLVSRPFDGAPYSTSHMQKELRKVMEVCAKGSRELNIPPWREVWAEELRVRPKSAYNHLPTAARADRTIDIRATPDIFQYQPRDLRRTAVVNLFRAGCSPHQAAAISGHSLLSVNSIMEVYGPRDTTMADAAIEKLEEHLKEEWGDWTPLRKSA